MRIRCHWGCERLQGEESATLYSQWRGRGRELAIAGGTALSYGAVGSLHHEYVDAGGGLWDMVVALVRKRSRTQTLLPIFLCFTCVKHGGRFSDRLDSSPYLVRGRTCFGAREPRTSRRIMDERFQPFESRGGARRSHPTALFRGSGELSRWGSKC
jgi:hypothetical protein